MLNLYALVQEDMPICLSGMVEHVVLESGCNIEACYALECCFWHALGLQKECFIYGYCGIPLATRLEKAANAFYAFMALYGSTGLIE